MELIGSLLLILAVALVVALFILQPFIRRQAAGLKNWDNAEASTVKSLDHQRSSLLAERDQVLTALQELDFDNALGKVPEENYREQRMLLLKKGADALRRLDEMNASTAQPTSRLDQSVEEQIEAAVAARRADARRVDVRQDDARQDDARQDDAVSATADSGADPEAAVVVPAAQTINGGDGNGKTRDSLEDMIASRKRARKESAAGFCPRCGRPVSKSDKFCSRCGAVL